MASVRCKEATKEYSIKCKQRYFETDYNPKRVLLPIDTCATRVLPVDQLKSYTSTVDGCKNKKTLNTDQHVIYIFSKGLGCKNVNKQCQSHL